MIEVTAALGVVTVQDAGRPGWMHQGIPSGGALVPALLARANRAAGNAPGTAGLEIVGSVRVRALAGHVMASDDGDARSLSGDETFDVSCGAARVRYLAVRGGVDVPLVLGSRSTLLTAALGGHLGRALRKGDTLPVGAPSEASPRPKIPDVPDLAGPVRIVPGPDFEAFAAGALELLLRSAYAISPRSDRVGVRLEGPPLARAGDDAGGSAPMVRGAIQVPAAGEAIVLGPDGPTRGGYPVIATVVGADLGAVMARPGGCVLRFALAEPG